MIILMNNGILLPRWDEWGGVIWGSRSMSGT
jgi:hypothetical protein